MAVTTANNTVLERDEIWSKMIQEELQEELMGMGIVNWLDAEFPDGDKLTIPTLNSLAVQDYVENAAIAVQDPTSGEFNLTIDKYYQAGVAITDKKKQDTYYMKVLDQKFPEQCVRAVAERLENDIFLLHKKQTTNDANTINGQPHRFDATGSGQIITLKDIAQAKLSLDKANVSKAGRMAVVDPTVSYQLVQIDNVIRQDVYGPQSNLKEGFGSTKFIGRYLGFDFYESNLLDEATALDHSSASDEIANMFLGPEAFVGAMRLKPEIEYFRENVRKRDVFHVTTRYGLGLYRPEALVVVLTA